MRKERSRHSSAAAHNMNVYAWSGVRACGVWMWLFLIVLTLPTSTQSFAYWMENDYCDRNLSPGTLIMNEKVVKSQEAQVRVFRGRAFDEEVTSGEYLYKSGEQLMVKLFWAGAEDGASEVIFEVSGAEVGSGFLAGGCGGRRISRDSSILQMPVITDSTEEGEILNIWAGWASTYGVVHVSEVFSLLPATDDNIQIAVLRAEGIIRRPVKLIQDYGISRAALTVGPTSSVMHAKIPSSTFNKKLEDIGTERKGSSAALNRLRGRKGKILETNDDVLYFWHYVLLSIMLIIFISYAALKWVRNKILLSKKRRK